MPLKTSPNVIENPSTNREVNSREQNIIIYGLKEDAINDQHKLREIFQATATQHTPLSMYRLGIKKTDKNRPILVRMPSTQVKDDFMSKLWMLKNVRKIYSNLSIANDYTLHERKTMKKYVEEANARNMIGTKGYIWKVRGTPKDGIRICKIAKQE